MNHIQFFEQAIKLTGSQLGNFTIKHDAEYPMRVAELVRLNYQAVILAWNDIQPDTDGKSGAVPPL